MNSLHQQLAPFFTSSHQQLALVARMNGVHFFCWHQLSLHTAGRLPVWYCSMSGTAKQQLTVNYATFQLAGLWRPGT